MPGPAQDARARLRRQVGRTASVAAIALALAAPAAAQGFVQRVPTSFFGVNGQGVMALSKPRTGDPAALAAQLDSIQRTGASWIRAGLDWASVEPNAPIFGSHTYDWSTYDAWVRALAQRHLRWHVTLRNPPAWSQDQTLLLQCQGRQRQVLPPRRPADFGTFAAAVARRYGPNGTFWKENPSLPYMPVREYEVFNEENDAAYWCPQPDPAAYSRLYVAAHDSIHAVDGTARVLVGGLAPNRFLVAPPDPHAADVTVPSFLRGMVNAEPGLAAKLDAVGVHSYRRDPADVLADIAWFRRTLERAGLGSAPLEITETGWPTQGPDAGTDVPEAQRAANYASLTDQVARTDCNLVGFAPFTWLTPEQNTLDAEDWYGIANQDATLKPSGQAYASEVKLFLGQGSLPAPRTTLRVCGLPLPDTDGDGVPDQADDYPLDPTRSTGSGEHNPADDPAPQSRFQPSRVPDEFFGMTGIGNVRGLLSEDQQVQYAAMHDAGVGAVRGIVDWAEVEPLPPSSPYHDYQWTELDRSVRRAAMHGMRWVPTFRDAPAWALSASPGTQARAQFATFLQAFAARYGRGGSFWDENRGLPQLPVTEYEIWYRANVPAQWPDGTPSPAEYADFYLAARAALHAVDPKAIASLSLSNAGSEPDHRFVADMVSARPALAGEIDGAHLVTSQTTASGIESDVADLRSALDESGNAVAGITLEFALQQAGPGAVSDDQRATTYTAVLDTMARSDCGVAGVFPRGWTSDEQNLSSAEDWVGIARPGDGSLYAAGQAYAHEALLFEGRTAERAPYGTVHLCGRAAPDADGDGVPDESDDYPLDPSRVSGSDANGDGIFNDFDPGYVPGADTTPPVVHLSPMTSPTADATPVATFASDDPGAAFECRFDTEADFVPCAGSYAPASSLPDGLHLVWVRAADPSGNMSDPVSTAVVVDTTGPSASIDSGPTTAQAVSDATPGFTFSSPEANATFTCAVDGGPALPCASPYDIPAVPDGQHTLAVRAVDPLGNAGPPASRTFLTDTTPPVVHFDSGPVGTITTAIADFSFSAVGRPVRFDCRLDGGTWRTCSSPVALAGLLDGSHSFSVRAADAAGNLSAPLTRSFSVQTQVADTTPPSVSIDSGPAGPTRQTAPAFAFSSDDPQAAFSCRLDGASFAPCTSPYSAPSLPEGGHTFYVRATDRAGNTGAAVSRSFTVDTTAPVAHIDSGPTGTITSAVADFSFSAVGRPVRFDCRLDGAAFAACTSPVELTGLADGPHVFAIRAADAAGNLSVPVSRSFTVDTQAPDTTPPAVSIDSGPTGPTNDASPSFAFSSDDPQARFACRLDGASFGPCSSPLTLGPLPDGSHTLYVRAVDAAGNTGTAASRAFAVDTTAPIAHFDSGPTGTITATSASFSFSAVGRPVGFECSLDGAAYAACSSPATLDALGAGAHSFSVRAFDAAANRSAPVTRSFKVAPPAGTATDTTPPNTSLVRGPGTGKRAVTTDRTPGFRFVATDPDSTDLAFRCSLDGGAYRECSSPHETRRLDRGRHVFRVLAVDRAGNREARPARAAFRIAR